jgi:hypothetical protein
MPLQPPVSVWINVHSQNRRAKPKDAQIVIVDDSILASMQTLHGKSRKRVAQDGQQDRLNKRLFEK